MTKILYPTRGGESAQRNQEMAIEFAQERGAELLWLYVSNVHFLNHTAAPVRIDLIEAELDELGEFLLAMAQERAERAGIKSDSIIRHGSFRQAVRDVVDEFGVSTVILGRPADKTAITTVDYIQEVAKFINRESGVEVFLTINGQFTDHLLPPEIQENTTSD